MDIRQDKQQSQQNPASQQAGQVAQPAEESLKMHGDQLEKPLHEMLEDDERHEGGSEEAKPAKSGQDQRQ